METKFSEFQFAYSISREIEDKIMFSSYNLGVPTFPNQVEEGRLGYDVRFEGFKAVFLQYKIPIKLTRSTAKEWPDFNREYFRIELYSNDESPQHNLLHALAQNNKNKVYYCAPAFTEVAEFIDLHNKRKVSDNSAFINVHSLSRILGAERHRIVYQIKPLISFMHSELKRAEIKMGWENIISELSNTPYKNIEEFAESFREYAQTLTQSYDNPLEFLIKISHALALEGIQLLLLK